MSEEAWAKYIKEYQHVSETGMIPCKGDNVALMCQCGGHGMHLSWFVDEETIFNPCLYLVLGMGDTASWRFRLSHIWQYLRYGYAHLEEVSLEPEAALKLRDFINRWLRWLKTQTRKDLRIYFESNLLELEEDEKNPSCATCL